eukprot:19639-Ditylum_brightwellii.AAC.1
MEKFTNIASCMENMQQQMVFLTTEMRETEAEVAYLCKENAKQKVLIEEMYAAFVGKKIKGIKTAKEGAQSDND